MIRYLLFFRSFVRLEKKEKENKNRCLEAIGITFIGRSPVVTDVTTRFEQTNNVKIPMTLQFGRIVRSTRGIVYLSIHTGICG